MCVDGRQIFCDSYYNEYYDKEETERVENLYFMAENIYMDKENKKEAKKEAERQRKEREKEKKEEKLEEKLRQEGIRKFTKILNRMNKPKKKKR